MRSKTEIYSIFGQIDAVVAEAMAVVAEAMVAEGKATKIEQSMIPPTALYDERGRKASFAIVLPNTLLSEFNRRVLELAA